MHPRNTAQSIDPLIDEEADESTFMGYNRLGVGRQLLPIVKSSKNVPIR